VYLAESVNTFRDQSDMTEVVSKAANNPDTLPICYKYSMLHNSASFNGIFPPICQNCHPKVPNEQTQWSLIQLYSVFPMELWWVLYHRLLSSSFGHRHQIGPLLLYVSRVIVDHYCQDAWFSYSCTCNCVYKLYQQYNFYKLYQQYN